MNEQKILKIIKEFAHKLPKLPDGRIDYSSSKKAPVVGVLVKYKDKILLLKRSKKVLHYSGKWNVISGYLDELKTIRQKVLEELKEELGIEEDNILSIQTKEPYDFVDKDINKTWIIHPVLVNLKKKSNIKIDWEHSEYKWIKPEESKKFDIVPSLGKGLENILPDGRDKSRRFKIS